MTSGSITTVGRGTTPVTSIPITGVGRRSASVTTGPILCRAGGVRLIVGYRGGWARTVPVTLWAIKKVERAAGAGDVGVYHGGLEG